MGVVGDFFEETCDAIGDFVSDVGDTISDLFTGGSATAGAIGATAAYDSETASILETKKINDILSTFAIKLEKKADKLEILCIKESGKYFENFIEGISKLNGSNGIKINVNSIKRDFDKITNDSKGSFKKYLAKRVSIDDDECLEILKLDEGEDKKLKMKKFGGKVLKEAKEQLCDNIQKTLDSQGQYISEELNAEINNAISKLANMNSGLKELEGLKLSGELDMSLAKAEFISHIVGIDSTLELLK